MTPAERRLRQELGFAAYRAAVELYTLERARPVQTAEESRARWQVLQRLRQAVDDAHDEMHASIVDAMGADDDVGPITIVEAPGDRCHGLRRIFTPEGDAECPGCRACS